MKAISTVVASVPVIIGFYPTDYLEAALGIGYAHVRYDKFKCTACGQRMEKGGADYLGPTRVSLSIIYILK